MDYRGQTPSSGNSLAQTLLKLTAPGIPDIYQGAELWDLSLVDPDNRRPVDYSVRRRLLAVLDRATPQEIMARIERAAPPRSPGRRASRPRRAGTTLDP
jgi:(1->4)-alpha-D-glucan 1-alpha-D-glucosylmutase